MKKENFTIKEFNHSLNLGISNQDLDFGSLIVGLYKNLISVTAEYMPPSGNKRYVTLDKSFNVVEVEPGKKAYYGVSPRFDNDMILQELSKLRFRRPSGLDEFISEHCDLFMLHYDRSEYLLDMARLIVLSVVSNFGIKLKLNDEVIDLLTKSEDNHRTTVKHIKKDKKQKSKRKEEQEEKLEEYHLLGCPTDNILETLSEIRFERTKDGFWKVAPNGLSIEEIYSDINNIAYFCARKYC